MGVSRDLLIDQLASRQAGCVSRAQAVVVADFSDHMIRRRVRSGRWRRTHKGVYCLASIPPSWNQEVWSAALAASRPTAGITDVAVTHETALLTHGLAPSWLPRYPITLTVPNGRRVRLEGVTVHQIGDLAPHHLVDVDGLPVGRPARALVDIAASFGDRHLGRVLDELVRADKVSYAQVSTCLSDVARRGKPGVSRLGGLLDERGPGTVPPQSELERRLFEVIGRAGLPQPVRQFPLPSQHPGAELVDAAYVDEKVLIEVDGRRWHSRVSDFERDRCRDTEAAQAGWVVLRFTYEQISTAPKWVAERITRVLAMRRSQLSPT